MLLRPVPVLVAHGILDNAKRIAPLSDGLRQRGVQGVHAVDLVPNDGRAPIADLGRFVAREVEELARRESVAQVDLVGFSMGALVSRWVLQRGGGKERVRRFISIAGPHRGTLTAYAAPLRGVRDMRPGSELLRDLESDPDPFGAVEVHCVYTPFDLMIVPPRSAVLAGATSVRSFPVPMHRFMIRDSRVLDHVAGLLRSPQSDEGHLTVLASQDLFPARENLFLGHDEGFLGRQQGTLATEKRTFAPWNLVPAREERTLALGSLFPAREHRGPRREERIVASQRALPATEERIIAGEGALLATEQRSLASGERTLASERGLLVPEGRVLASRS